MLFRKDMEKRCVHCEKASVIDENDMLCRKYGVVSRNYGCKKFEYDPLKRIPNKTVYPDSDRYDTKDFSLLTTDEKQENAT